jgi:hypothetical protein
MTETTHPPASEAVSRALEAAQLATDAAHEAEAVILARAEATAAMDRTARRSTILAGVAGGAALISLLAGTAIWWRAAADLRDAAAVQASASAAFVERLAEMNSALDRMEAAELALTAGEDSLAAGLAQIAQMLTARLPEPAADAGVTADVTAGADLPGADRFTMQIDALRADILAAIAEAEMSMAERMVQLAATMPATPPAATLVPRPSPVAGASGAGTAPAATRPATRPEGAARRAAPPAQPNPFRYP